jgi:hypothetical protein
VVQGTFHWVVHTLLLLTYISACHVCYTAYTVKPARKQQQSKGVTGRQGMLTPSRHLIPPLVCLEILVCSIFRICISYGSMRLITVSFITFHPYQITEKEAYNMFLEYIKYELLSINNADIVPLTTILKVFMLSGVND